MTTRHNQRSQGTTVDLLASRLPDRFLDLSLTVQDGILVGLTQYISGMTEWIDSELGTTERDRRNGETTGQQITPELMRELGCEPAEWYKRILSGFDQPDAVNKPDAEHGQIMLNGGRDIDIERECRIGSRPPIRVP
jgi:hypothetical protein